VQALGAEHELPSAADLVGERFDAFGGVPVRDRGQAPFDHLGDEVLPRGGHECGLLLGGAAQLAESTLGSGELGIVLLGQGRQWVEPVGSFAGPGDPLPGLKVGSARGPCGLELVAEVPERLSRRPAVERRPESIDSMSLDGSGGRSLTAATIAGWARPTRFTPKPPCRST